MLFSKQFFTTTFLSIICCSITQCQPAVKSTGKVKSPAFDHKIASLLDFSIPVLSVEEVKSQKNVQYLDARERKEYDISHIPGAQYIGYSDWNPRSIQTIPVGQTVVVYCSIGYRSEKIAEKIKALGYTKVYNLYGSIFEWANAGLPLENNQHQPTMKLHTYNKKWSEWVDNKKVEKVW